MRPGWKTSEFWLSLAALVLSALMASDAFPAESPGARWIAIAASWLGAMGYTVSRSLLKRQSQ